MTNDRHPWKSGARLSQKERDDIRAAQLAEQRPAPELYRGKKVATKRFKVPPKCS